VPSLEKIERHRAPHDAQTDKTNFHCHSFTLVADRTSLARKKRFADQGAYTEERLNLATVALSREQLTGDRPRLAVSHKHSN
jgi:hypothetical protein